MFRGAFSRMFTAAGCHGRPPAAHRLWDNCRFVPTGSVPPLGVFPSSLRSHYNENSDYFSSPKTNATIPLLSLLEFVPEAPFKNKVLGAPGWRSRLSVRLQPGHDLTVREFEPRIRLWADGSEPGACFRFCVSLSLCPSPVHALSLSVPKKINVEKKIKKKKK